MKKTFYLVIVVVIFLMFPFNVSANIICNDGTVSTSCADCHRGCCSHHGGCSNSSSVGTNNYSNNNSSSNYQQYNVKEITKSSDTSLKELIVNDNNIDISNNMSYSTKKEKAIIYAAANDSKAHIEYKKNVDLNIGDNDVNIKITAENGDIKEYSLIITREKVLSNNKSIKIKVDDEEIKFDSFKSHIIYLSNNKDKLNINYELESKEESVKIIGNENLKVGENEVIVRVTAENGEEQDYTLIVDKYEKFEETIINIIAYIITIGLFGGIGFLIYFLVKRSKKIRF